MRMIAGTTWRVEDARKYIEDRVVVVPWSGCWLWDLALLPNGYGKLTAPRRVTGGVKKTMSAHRLSFEAFNGELADGMCVCHRCDVRACCNPDHLWLGSQKENVEDCAAKGRRAPPLGEAHGNAKLTLAQVLEIRAIRKLGGMSQAQLAAKFGVSQSLISMVARGAIWSHVGPA